MSIVATALHGSETRPYLNLVNIPQAASYQINRIIWEGLFIIILLTNMSYSIDGATALKLDESYEIKT